MFEAIKRKTLALFVKVRNYTNNDKIRQLLIKFQAGELNSEERLELDRWIQNDYDRISNFEMLKRVNDFQREFDNSAPEAYRSILQKLTECFPWQFSSVPGHAPFYVLGKIIPVYLIVLNDKYIDRIVARSKGGGWIGWLVRLAILILLFLIIKEWCCD